MRSSTNRCPSRVASDHQSDVDFRSDVDFCSNAGFHCDANSQPPATSRKRLVWAVSVICFIVMATGLQTGCLGIVSNLMHAVGADKVPPESEALQDSKTAVVVITDESQYSDDIVARLLTRKLSDLLSMEVKGLTIVREEAVQQYRDTRGWDKVDYMEIGKAVEAEKVLAVEMTDLRLRDGATLFRGRANVTLTVYDITEQKVVFRKDIDEYMFPTSAGQYTTETTESKFRKLFLEMLSRRIGRVFHAYDFTDTIALDGTLASQ